MATIQQTQISLAMDEWWIVGLDVSLGMDGCCWQRSREKRRRPTQEKVLLKSLTRETRVTRFTTIPVRIRSYCYGMVQARVISGGVLIDSFELLILKLHNKMIPKKLNFIVIGCGAGYL